MEYTAYEVFTGLTQLQSQKHADIILALVSLGRDAGSTAEGCPGALDPRGQPDRRFWAEAVRR
jgi:hypothetical protein